MTLNLNNGLTGLSLLTGSNGFASFGSSASSVETLAVRKAKAAFTTPAALPPWKEASTPASLSSQVSAIRRMASIVEPEKGAVSRLSPDIATAFTTYKALDKLRALAEAAVAGPTASVRETLQGVFAKGLQDLEKFVGSAESDKLALSFDQPARSVKTVPTPAAGTFGYTLGEGVAEAREAPLPALTGTEKFAVTIRRGTSSDTINVDLAGGPQPPTLDSVSTAINDAIEAVPLRNADGSVNLDADGNPVPRWLVRFVPDKSTGSWGFKVTNPGLEEVSIDQVGGADALMVATGMTDPDGPASAQIMRIDDPAGVANRLTLSTISATDRLATERAELLATKYKAIEGVEQPSTDRYARTTTRGIVTAPDGSSYIVGTTAGDLGSSRASGTEDLFLTKVDSEGKVVWQRELGATGSASGAAISLGPNGEIVVAGTVAGSFDGGNADGDMLVARFNAGGEELSSTVVRALGADNANAVAVGADGSIYVGGRSSSGGGDAFIARLDADGVLRERRRIDSGGGDTVNALAIGQGGELLALTREGTEAKVRRLDAASLATDLGSYALGSADARVMAVADDGTIAVGGATSAALNGGQVNTLSGGRDGFVARLSADLGSADVSYLGNGADDQIDSLSFLGGSLYAGGRTAGDLAGTRSGTTDGFIARLDAGSGAIADTRQFGLAQRRTEAVRIAGASGGSTVLGALGLQRGVLTEQPSTLLTAQTSLRAGDQFSIMVNGGAARRITIDADETLASLSAKIGKITGSAASVTTPSADGGRSLSISAKPGNVIELVAGQEGRDALDKLGLPAARMVAGPAYDPKAPKVAPGGTYGLDLTHALDLSTKEGAALALKRVNSAISMTQTAYRSLYWDDAKAAIVNGTKSLGGVVSPYQQAQLARYQDALTRISGVTASFGSSGGILGL